MQNRGNDLFSLLEAGAIDDPSSDMRQIVSGVRHMHGRGVAHMDLKLDNIVKKDGVVCIVDMGLALRVVGSVRGYRGTRSYAAPELHRDAPYDPFRTDMWSLGVVAYALFHGHFLMREAKENDVRFAHLASVQGLGFSPASSVWDLQERFLTKQRAAPPPPLHAALRALLDVLLWVDPAKRALPAEDALQTLLDATTVLGTKRAHPA